MTEIRIQWLGHSAFAIEKDGYRIVLDPYKDGSVDGLPDLRTEADLVLCSHEHDDHAGRECVRIQKSGKPNPFEIQEIHSFHDGVQGRKRGTNTIRIFSDGKYKIVHMGDIGCALSEHEKDMLRGADVILVPVGGYFTLEPEEIKALMDELDPTVVVPMHYRGRGFGYPVIGTLSSYTDLCSDVVYYDGDSLNLPENLQRQTAVLRFEGEPKQ